MKQRTNLIKIVSIGIIGVLLVMAYAQRYRFVNQKLKAAPVKLEIIGRVLERRSFHNVTSLSS